MILGKVNKAEGEKDFGDVPESWFAREHFEVELINLAVKLLTVRILGLFV